MADLEAKLMADEGIQTLGNLEPVALDCAKVVKKAVADSGGDEGTARQKIADIAADTSKTDEYKK